MNKKEMLIEYAKEIAEHCAEHDECDEKCAFYTKYGNHPCLFHTAYYPPYWDFNTVEEN